MLIEGGSVTEFTEGDPCSCSIYNPADGHTYPVVGITDAEWCENAKNAHQQSTPVDATIEPGDPNSGNTTTGITPA